MGTEEDGVDEARSATQSPFIMSPGVRNGNGSSVPLPADGIGAAKAAKKDSAPSVNSANDGAAGPALGAQDRKPSFTPSSPSAAPSSATPAPSPAPSPSPYQGSPYPGSSYSGSSYSGSSYSGSAPPGYSTTRPSYAPPYNSPHSAWTPQSAPAAPAGAPPAGPGGPGVPPGYPMGGPPGAVNSGFSPTAVGGAANGIAGYANSVATAWQNRSNSKRRLSASARRANKRQAMLTLARVEPWSVMKFSFVSSIVAFIILFVAVAVLYMVLAALGVFDAVQHDVSTITSAQNTAGTNISHYFSASLILGYTAMLGALNVVLITAICTVGSVIYNLIAKAFGGIEITLRETD